MLHTFNTWLLCSIRAHASTGVELLNALRQEGMVLHLKPIINHLMEISALPDSILGAEWAALPPGVCQDTVLLDL